MTEHTLTLKRQTGNKAEACAKDYLLSQGLSFVQANYLCKTGEIDLIMKQQDTLVFVEVRYKKSSEHGSPIESITYPKQQRVLKAAEYYLLENDLSDHFCRFDVVGITGEGKQMQIEWIKDAFGVAGW
jgi:putative endonuclease